MAAKKPVKPTETKSYILTMRDKTKRKITIPAHWKLTFGSLIPYSGRPGSGDPTPALRVYEGNKENLRAAFRDVMEFCDSDIGIAVPDGDRVVIHAKQKGLKNGDMDVDLIPTDTPIWKDINVAAYEAAQEPDF